MSRLKEILQDKANESLNYHREPLAWHNSPVFSSHQSCIYHIGQGYNIKNRQSNLFLDQVCKWGQIRAFLSFET